VAETWEVSDVEGRASVVVDGPWAGTSLHDLTVEHPDELVGRG
jgi:mannose-6-phosphate isomerase